MDLRSLIAFSLCDDMQMTKAQWMRGFTGFNRLEEVRIERDSSPMGFLEALCDDPAPSTTSDNGPYAPFSLTSTFLPSLKTVQFIRVEEQVDDESEPGVIIPALLNALRRRLAVSRPIQFIKVEWCFSFIEEDYSKLREVDQDLKIECDGKGISKIANSEEETGSDWSEGSES
jgi:hypothetical protein